MVSIWNKIKSCKKQDKFWRAVMFKFLNNVPMIEHFPEMIINISNNTYICRILPFVLDLFAKL